MIADNACIEIGAVIHQPDLVNALLRESPRPMATLSVVVPVYNSARTLIALVGRLHPVLEQNSREYELILVNDGSRDASWNVIRELHRRHKWVRGINQMSNYGQHAALLTGIRAARHELIVTIDDDLQNPPEEIPRMLQELSQGHDVVYGAPREGQHGLLRNAASRLTKFGLQSAMGVESASRASAFRIFPSHLRNAFRHYDGPFVSIDVLLSWGTKKFTSVSVVQDERREGQSNYTLAKLLTHALNLITGFSTLPLRVATFIGFGFTIVGLGVLLYVVGHFLFTHGSVPGFPFLASIIAIFSGAQLCALGIIGEYIARIHVRSMGAPSSVTREQIGFEI